MHSSSASLNILLLIGLVRFLSSTVLGHPDHRRPIRDSSSSGSGHTNLEEMVAVSSTVIPVASLFGNPRSEASGSVGSGQVFSLFPTFTYSRRSRFYDKSSKPEEPVRLITKNVGKEG